MNTIRPTAPGLFPVLPDGTHTVALGNASQFKIHLQRRAGGGELFVGVLSFGCYAFTFPPHPSYIAEKLRLEPGDAENVADLIACQFGQPPTQPEGYYNPRLLAKPATPQPACP
jgi:hypothetical protein